MLSSTSPAGRSASPRCTAAATSHTIVRSALLQSACVLRHRPFTSEPAPPCTKCHGQAQSTASSGSDHPSHSSPQFDRRQALVMLLGASSILATPAVAPQPAQANIAALAPPGYRSLVDKLDGYSFFYPERWLPVTVTGNDCFFRNPTNIDENLFVDISSPSSSQYKSVTDLGSPEQTAQLVLRQLLDKEFMSTRLGIRREGEVLSYKVREGKDGRTYYDIAVRITSYASRNPYVATQGEVMKDFGVEWDRVLLTTLGVANNRLYEFRLQTAKSTLEQSLPVLTEITQSFTLQDIQQA